MVSIPRRTVKLGYLLHRQNGKCCCGHALYMHEAQLHHKLPDTTLNRVNYPLFIHSLLNLQAVCANCHMGAVSGKLEHLTYYHAERYEGFLKRHERFEKFVNRR